MNKQPVDVVCAVLVKKGKILLVKRSAKMEHAGFWELPGGKIEKGEKPTSAIVRECNEELGLDIEAVEVGSEIVHAYTQFVIRLIPIICKVVSGQIHLFEHDDFAFVRPEDMDQYMLSAADRLLFAKNDYFSPFASKMG